MANNHPVLRDQRGSHVVALLVGLVVVAVIGFAGYTVYQRSNKAADTTASTSNTASTVPASINSKADLTSAAKVLDDSSSQVNAGVNGSQLDSDINSLL